MGVRSGFALGDHLLKAIFLQQIAHALAAGEAPANDVRRMAHRFELMDVLSPDLVIFRVLRSIPDREIP